MQSQTKIKVIPHSKAIPLISIVLCGVILLTVQMHSVAQCNTSESVAPKTTVPLQVYQPNVSAKYSVDHMDRLQHNASLVESFSNFPYRVHFSTYATEADRYRNARIKLVRQAQHSGWFQSAYGFGPLDLPPRFQQEFAQVLALKRGGGYWIWRFAVMEMMMARIPFGDFFVFADADCTLNKNGKKKLISWLDQLNASVYDEISFEIPYIEKVWTTHRLFKAFNVSEYSTIRTTRQRQGGILIMRNGLHLRKILSAIYQVLAMDPMLITDVYHNETKVVDKTFRENRHDQSIHSLASKIHGSLVLPHPEGGSGKDKPFRHGSLKNLSWEKILAIEAGEKW